MLLIDDNYNFAEWPEEVNGLSKDVAADNLWMEVGDVRRLEFTNLLLSSAWDQIERVPELIVELCRDPNYLHFVVKYILNIDLLPFQCVILQTLWHKPLVMFIATRGGGKSYMLAVYLITRMILHQGCKVAVVGASLRQSMVIFNYVQQIYENAPILRDICGNESPKRDIHMCFWKCGHSRATFLPLGDGSKIRGQRANIIIADEFASIPQEVFETVVRGFAAVKSDGVHLNVQKAYKKKVLDKLLDDAGKAKHKEENAVPTALEDNQIVIAGTAFYQFNHFYKYFSYYRAIITSGGDRHKLRREFPDMPMQDNIDPSNYAIIRLPYDKIPKGMMDETILTQGRATMDPQIFDMEYGACFPADSEGFYLASVLQDCTCPVKVAGKEDIVFAPRIYGDPKKRYVMGIDPASEDDNFAVCIMEDCGSYRAVVYQWTTNRKQFEELKRDPLKPIYDNISDYNTFIVTHLRDLLRRFNIQLVVMDAAGGGVSVRESLRDQSKLLDLSDDIIYDMDDENVKGFKGRHILKMIEFSSLEWRREAYHGLRQDFRDRKVLFPYYDAAEITIQSYKDSKVGRNFDRFEDCYLEIEQCKQETTLIRHEQTPTGQEKWDVPKVVGIDAEQVKKTLKKDRFTSLLLANWGFRFLEAESYIVPTEVFGGVARQMVGQEIKGVPFIGKGAARLKHMPEFDLSGLGVMHSVSDPNRKIFY